MTRIRFATGILAGLALAGAGLAEPKATTGTDGQDCMSADLGIMPARVTYTNGQTRILLRQSGKVSVWQIESPDHQPFEYRAKFSFFALTMGNADSNSVWDWSTSLPDLYAIEATGKAFLAEGTRTMTGKQPIPVLMEVLVLGREEIEFKGCVYQVMQLKIVHTEAGKPVSETLMSYDPELWMSFRTERRPKNGSPVEITEPIEIVTTR